MDVGNQGMVVKGRAFRNALCCLGNVTTLVPWAPNSRWVLAPSAGYRDTTLLLKHPDPGVPSPSEGRLRFYSTPPLHRKVLYSFYPQNPLRDQRHAKDLASVNYREGGSHVLPNSERKRTQGPTVWGLEEVPPLN